jgi:hypothetical protein
MIASIFFIASQSPKAGGEPAFGPLDPPIADSVPSLSAMETADSLG